MVKRWLSILLILMLAGPAMAGGANIYLRVKGHGGGYLASGYAACYDGSVTVGPTDVNGTKSASPPNVGTEQRVFINGNNYLSSSITGPNFLYDDRISKTVNIVAWEGDSIANVIAEQGYYGIYSYTTAGEGASPVNVPTPFPGDFTLNYRAAPPPPPTASASGFNLTWDEGLGDYLVAFTVSAQKSTAYNTQYSASDWALQVVRAGDDWSTAKQYAGQSASVVEDNPDSPYFVASGSYMVRAKAGNNFGQSEWGAPTAFDIPAGGGGGVATSFTFDLKKAETDKLIVNSITVPANNLAQPKVATVNTASDLAGVINDYAVTAGLAEEGVKVVVAIYGWNTASGQAEGVAFDNEGNLVEGSSDFSIQPGVGVQVYTTVDISSITFKGQ